MSSFGKIAILGPGLLGGSLALAAMERKLASKVVLWGRRAEVVEEAQKLKAADVATTGLTDAVEDADVILLCTPVGVMADLVRSFLPVLKPTALVTDVGSVKVRVEEELAPLLKGKARWIGSHPMAGSDQAGLSAAQPKLFNGATCILTPTAETEPSALAEARALWEALGTRVTELDPATHDARVGKISHLPHLIAAILVESADFESLLLAGSGFRDTTRVAAGPAPMWTEILLSNREAVLDGLDSFLVRAAAAREALSTGNAARLNEFLQRANAVRSSLK
jgi:prephenate dehydrogenase